MGKRFIAALLACLMLIPALVACGKVESDDTTTLSSDTTAGEKEYLSEYDIKGQTVSILYWEDAKMQEFVAEASDGTSLVNDAIYKRNNTVQTSMGVNLNFIPAIGGYGSNHDDYYNLVEVDARTGAGQYDILSCYSCAIAYLASAGYSVNLLNFDMLDFNADWWNESLITNATINNKLLFCSGDISTQLLYMMECCWFNTDMINSYGLESPYDLVSNNEWTLTKMLSLTNGIYEDLDLSGGKTNKDHYGLGLYYGCIESMYFGSGLKLFDIVNGYPTLSEDFTGEKCRDLIVQLVEAFATTDCYIGELDVRDMFGEGRSLLIIDSPFMVDTNLNNYENCNYGIVPVPKWDITQEDYYTAVRTTCSLYCISAASKNQNSAAIVMEALGYYGHKYVTPALFESTMKYQYALDDKGSQMFEIIRDSIIFDFGRSFNDILAASPMLAVVNKVRSGDTNWISYVARMRTPIDRSVETIIENFKKYYPD